MKLTTLKGRLVELGLDPGPIDGPWDARTRAAVMAALTDGPDWRLEESDFTSGAHALGCDVAPVRTVYMVESTGSPFVDGRPAILFEPHRFSRATGHRYDSSHPAISSRTWNRRLYPATQTGRWNQLLDAVALDIDAGFASASYGGFQILGENYAACGASSPWSFAWRQAQTEGDQLDAFVSFVLANKLAGALRDRDWARFARGYNGTAYRENHYDERLAAAYAREVG